jgi:hypothetical protein
MSSSSVSSKKRQLDVVREYRDRANPPQDSQSDNSVWHIPLLVQEQPAEIRVSLRWRMAEFHAECRRCLIVDSIAGQPGRGDENLVVGI